MSIDSAVRLEAAGRVKLAVLSQGGAQLSLLSSSSIVPRLSLEFKETAIGGAALRPSGGGAVESAVAGRIE